MLGEEWTLVCPSLLFAQVLRVLKPGGHAVVFAAPGTQHLRMISLQLAGFEMRDVVAWVTKQGFPKGGNVGVGIDKMMGENSDDLEAPVRLVDITGSKYAEAMEREADTRRWRGRRTSEERPWS